MVAGGAVGGHAWFELKPKIEERTAALQGGASIEEAAEREQMISRFSDELTASYICYGVGGAFAATGLVLALLDILEDTAPEATEGAELMLTPGPGLRGAGMLVSF